MSTTWGDVAWEMAHADEAWQEAVKDIKDEAIIEFSEKQYEKYYIDNPEIHFTAFDILNESKMLLDSQHSSASVIYSFIAIESILRDLILRPLVWGTFIDEEVASLITNSILDNRFDQLSRLVFHFIERNISLDLRTLTSPSQDKSLWQEITELRSLRNSIVHRGSKCDQESAARAFEVANFIFNDIFLKVLDSVGFFIGADNRISQKK